VKRNTWQRAAVREALGEREGFVSAQQLHTALKSAGSPIGLATVYRALADLAVDGAADSLQSSDGESLYRACVSPGHHHHLICRSCGRTVEIEADAIEEWAAQAAAAHGFRDPQHVVDVFGTCAECARRQAGRIA
jgi:Fur family ferric uptake transcriptional regulator